MRARYEQIMRQRKNKKNDVQIRDRLIGMLIKIKLPAPPRRTSPAIEKYHCGPIIIK